MPWRDRGRRRRLARQGREEQHPELDDRMSAVLPATADDDAPSPHEPPHEGQGETRHETAAEAVQAPAEEVGPGADVAAVPPRERPDVPVRLGAVSDEEHARAVRRVVSRALAEDLGPAGDLTSMATVPAGAHGRAVLVAREPGVVAGLAVVEEVVRQVDGRIRVELTTEDGARVATDEVVARLDGPLRTLLAAERTVLNLVCQLSGVATHTAAFADAVAGTDCVVRDTRKTTPGLRLLEKRAVAVGGGANHRVGLHDAVLVKDNHVAAAGGIGAAARAALAAAPAGVHVQVEVTSLAEAEEAIAAGVEDLLLDNFTPDDLRDAVAAIAGRAAVEASGGITLATARDYAEAGADRLAVGALTHSAPALDLALDVEQVTTAGTGAQVVVEPAPYDDEPVDADPFGTDGPDPAPYDDGPPGSTPPGPDGAVDDDGR